jgi:hypothetical protein
MSNWLDGLNGALSYCRVQERSNHYQLRAKLPKKTDIHTLSHQTISTGLKATPDNVPLLRTLSCELDEQIRHGTFRWEFWTREALQKRGRGLDPGGITPAEFAQAIEDAFHHKYPAVEQSWKTIWGKKYQPAYRRMQALPVLVVDESSLRDLLLSIPGLAARKTDGSIYSSVIAFKGWRQFDRSFIYEAASGYSAAELTPRDIPSDEDLLSYYRNIDAPHWKTLYGLMLTYGCRPHEVINSVITSDGRLEISDGKTGARQAWPLMPEWVNELNLRDLCMPTQSINTIAKVASDYFREKRPGRPGVKTRPARLPFNLYTLRHAWAIRAMREGFTTSLAAKLLGHSTRVHEQTYRRWINKEHMDLMFHARYGTAKSDPQE